MTSISRLQFYTAPFLLIQVVFLTTFIFSYILEPPLLAIPLLVSYYSVIWIFVGYYNACITDNGPILSREVLLDPGYRYLKPWMIFWTLIYPFLVGIPSIYLACQKLPHFWFLLAIPFAAVNGPSEEIFWRLYMDRVGANGGISRRVRLWYSSVVFASWHFVFVVFLLPEHLLIPGLLSAISSTFLAGLLWMMVYQKTGKMFPNMLSHAILNLLVIGPQTAMAMLGLS